MESVKEKRFWRQLNMQIQNSTKMRKVLMMFFAYYNLIKLSI